jgi:hypothetical protein
VFVQGDPAGPESTLVNSARAIFASDHLYMIGESLNPVPPPGGGRNNDFSATRFVIPLFNVDFEAF